MASGSSCVDMGFLVVINLKVWVTSNRPARQRPGSCPVRSLHGRTPASSASRISCGEGVPPSSSCTLSSRAATPVTTGVAKLLPVSRAVPPPGTAPRTSKPGARTPCRP